MNSVLVLVDTVSERSLGYGPLGKGLSPRVLCSATRIFNYPAAVQRRENSENNFPGPCYDEYMTRLSMSSGFKESPSDKVRVSKIPRRCDTKFY
jgi:hypothetical protein